MGCNLNSFLGKNILKAEYVSYKSMTPYQSFFWEGTVYNPRKYDFPFRNGKTFFMTAEGETQTAIFDKEVDKLEINPKSWIGKILINLQFSPRLWHYREKGIHKVFAAQKRPSL